MKRNLLVLEINEFNRDLLVESAREFGLRHLQWLTSLKESRTLTDDVLQSDRLEPWVQWVNVHTGQQSLEHGIRHLGDVPDLSQPQIWEKLSQQGVTTGVWGPLNAQKGRADRCLYFVPDPWTFSESASPRDLDGLIDFPRYMAKNRVEFRWWKALGLFVAFCAKIPLSVWARLLLRTPQVLRTQLAFGVSASSLFLYFEYASALMFSRRTRSERPQVGILFLNSIAHLQHYYWRHRDLSANRRIYWVLWFMDDLVGRLRAELGADYSFVVLNALSQEQTDEKKAGCIYRVKDYQVFLPLLGLRPTAVEALMTYDATLFFADREDRDQAAHALASCRVLGQPLFKVETEGHPQNRLFMRTDVFEEVPSGTMIETARGPISFDEQVTLLARQTGRHHPVGTIFSEEVPFPAELPNHRFFETLGRLFWPSQGRDV